MNYLYVKDLLEGEYAEVFKRAEQYGMITCPDSKVLDELMMNLADVLLTAQKKEKPVEKIIGKDIEKFCTDYFSCITTTDRLKMFFRSLFYIFSFLLVLNVLIIFLGEKNISKDYEKLIFAIVIGACFGILTNIISILFAKSLFLKHPKATVRISSIFTWIFTFAAGAIAIFCIERFRIQIPMYTFLAISGLYVGVYLIIILYIRYKNTGSFANPEKKEKALLKQKISEEETLKIWINIYNTKNNRMEKRGKPPITKEEYMRKLRKSHCHPKRDSIITNVIMIIIVLAFVIPEIIFNNWVDGLTLLAVLLAVEIPLLCWLNKFGKENNNILKKCDELGIDIFEYQKRMTENDSVTESI